MKSWWEIMLELIILLPLKILEIALSSFAFILMAIATPFIQIIKAIKEK
jgi:hypothetical protein